MTQDYSLRHLKMAHRADCRGRLSTPDGYGKNTGQCGDTVEVFLQVRGELIQALRYEADGCQNTHACAIALAAVATGKTLDEAWQIRPGHLIDYIQTLPADHHHCAELVVGALYLALGDLRSHGQRAWMRLYQRPHR